MTYVYNTRTKVNGKVDPSSEIVQSAQEYALRGIPIVALDPDTGTTAKIDGRPCEEITSQIEVTKAWGNRRDAGIGLSLRDLLVLEIVSVQGRDWLAKVSSPEGLAELDRASVWTSEDRQIVFLRKSGAGPRVAIAPGVRLIRHLPLRPTRGRGGQDGITLPEHIEALVKRPEQLPRPSATMLAELALTERQRCLLEEHPGDRSDDPEIAWYELGSQIAAQAVNGVGLDHPYVEASIAAILEVLEAVDECEVPAEAVSAVSRLHSLAVNQNLSEDARNKIAERLMAAVRRRLFDQHKLADIEQWMRDTLLRPASKLILWPEVDRNGKPRSRSPANVCTLLDHFGITVWMNEHSGRCHVEGLPKVSVLDDAGIGAIRVLAANHGLDTPTDLLMDVLREEGKRNGRHPVREYIDGLKWDGVPRLDTWLMDFAGAEDTPLNRAISRKTLVAAVRRARRPGAKFDHMLTLVGRQGLRKSTLVRTLAVENDWFDECLPIGSDPKVTIEQTSGKWIVEIAELAGMRKRDVELVKAFISRTRDTARLSYGRGTATWVDRQFIMIGTVNDDAFLRDPTGNRRFWVVRVEGVPTGEVDDTGRPKRQINCEGLAEVVGQLWAEAAEAEANGEDLFLDARLEAEAERVQDQHRAFCPVSETLELHLDGLPPCRITMDTAFEVIGHKPDERHRRSDPEAQRIGNALTALKWTKQVGRAGGRRQTIYISPHGNSRSPLAEWHPDHSAKDGGTLLVPNPDRPWAPPKGELVPLPRRRAGS